MSFPLRVRLVSVSCAFVLLAAGVSAGAAAEPFKATVSPIGGPLRATMTGISWRPGCPVGLRDLRVVTARHFGFDGRMRTGRLIVHRDVATDVVTVLRRLYAARFPIRRMVPVDAYGASDFRSIEADNTSAFNCRYVEGTTRWSRACVRPSNRLQPDREPLRQRRADVTPCERAVRRPDAVPAGNGVPRQRRRAGVRCRRLELGRLLDARQGLPALLRERPLGRTKRTKRAAGFEPTTSSLEGWRSTN